MVVKNYNSCMNVSANEIDLDGMRNIVQRVIKTFQINTTSEDSNATLSEYDMDALADTIAYLARIGVPVFGEFWTIPDPRFPDVLIPSFGLNPYNSSDHALPARFRIEELGLVPKDNITDILRSVAPDALSSTSAPNVAQSVLNFAAAYAQAQAPLFKGDLSILELRGD
ncbi:hypothetical protein EK21DRAFT_112944 [Setomelanomma holmii]|uniref:Uncharacterized protein n=1 Tax=Setomelanomma holmii TaxID=210430 RepID=A0A9P4H992_9PLEO|nr:hypothetical protein EK21DRAFT_112944 [Setomelanomma holmii]